MDKYAIRPATEADVGKIQQMVRQAHLNPTGLAWQRFIVAVDPQGTLVGCVQIKPHRDHSQELASLVVAQAVRRQGLARALIEYMLSTQHGTLYLMCRAELGQFYARFGFRALKIDEMPPYFRRITRLASLAKWIQKADNGLLVMGRDDQR